LKTQPACRCQTCTSLTDPGGFCRHLTQDQLRALKSRSRWSRLQRGETIKSEDLLIWPIIAISSGVISFQQLLEDGRKIIAALFMRGDIVDMRGLANRHHGHLIALGKAEICRLSPRSFEAATDDNIDARKIAWSSLRRQSNRSMDHAADLAKKQALEKLASFIFECRHRLPDPDCDSKVHIPVRRLDLADYLGMQPETVSRCFKELQTRGIIGIQGISNLEILDFPRLRRIANGDKHTENLRRTHEDHMHAATGS
jgi:CRP/FNR family transcriptional regulator, anaerobic regulatory protein